MSFNTISESSPLGLQNTTINPSGLAKRMSIPAFQGRKVSAASASNATTPPSPIALPLPMFRTQDLQDETAMLSQSAMTVWA